MKLGAQVSPPLRSVRCPQIMCLIAEHHVVPHGASGSAVKIIRASLSLLLVHTKSALNVEGYTGLDPQVLPAGEVAGARC